MFTFFLGPKCTCYVYGKKADVRNESELWLANILGSHVCRSSSERVSAPPVTNLTAHEWYVVFSHNKIQHPNCKLIWYESSIGNSR